MLAEIGHPSGERYLAPGAAGFSPQEPRLPPTPAPRLGEHTTEVLSTVLGLSGGEIGRLRQAGVVGGEDHG
jgi:2-methylfumaryl-CoA isomerase